MSKTAFKGIVFSLLFALSAAIGASANDSHDHRAKHIMILLGENEIFASHVVYKQPHNYQVILKLSLNEYPERMIYLAEKRKYPRDSFILLLDTMDIGQIGSAESLSGTLFREDARARRFRVQDLRLNRANFEVLYFDELPLSLS